MEEINVVGGATGSVITIIGLLIINWWRSRNDSKKNQISQIDVLSNSLNSTTTTLISVTQRLDVVERERSAERDAANVARIQFQNRIDKLEDDQRIANGTIADLKHQIEVLQQEGRAKDGLLEQLRNRVNTLEKENCTLTAEKDELKTKLGDMQRALVASEQRAETQAQQIDKLNKRDTGPLAESPQPADSANPQTAEPGAEGKG
jgi:chromosome segregation ATPase